MLDGGGGNDTLTAAGTGARLNGGDGNDLLDAPGAGADLTGGLGNDMIEGGSGNDMPTIPTQGAVRVDSASLLGQSATGAAGTDFLGVHRACPGGEGDDTLLGSNAANLLVGGPGNDSVRARSATTR